MKQKAGCRAGGEGPGVKIEMYYVLHVDIYIASILKILFLVFITADKRKFVFIPKLYCLCV